MKNRIFLTVFFSCLLYTVFAQHPKAAHMVLNGNPEGAKLYYEGILMKDSLDFSANEELGLLLIEYFDDKGSALFYLDRAVRSQKKKEALPELYLSYAQALHFDGQYSNAITYYEKIISITQNTPQGSEIKKDAQRSIENCKYAMRNPPLKEAKKDHIKVLPTGINSGYPEFSPVVDPENTTLLYVSRKGIVLNEKKEDREDAPYGEMFIAHNTSGKFESGLPFVKQNSSEKFLENLLVGDVVMAMSADGKKILIRRTDQLFLSEFKDGSWQAPNKLPPTINIAPRLEGGACISNDGKTIYFSATKVGGYGRKDLYRSVLMESGVWSEAENLGEDINSADEEDAPFLNAEQNTLYYSSKSANGYGGYDIFKARIVKNGFSKPQNMGLPVNSPSDDINFWMNANETEGYLSSSRKGTHGDLDLFHILLFGKPASTCVPLAGPTSDLNIDFTAKDSIFENDSISITTGTISVKNGSVENYFWKINDTLVAIDSVSISKKFVREGIYNVTLQTAVYAETEDVRKDYCVTKQIHVFHPKVVDIFFEPLVKKDEDKLTIAGTVDVNTMRLDSSKKEILNIKLEPVYFNTNKFDLRKDAMEAIKRNISKMKVDPTIVIKLTALADPRATKDYNLKLSQKRANAVVAFLEKSGIKKKRIIAVLALGEEEAHVKKCKGDAACLEKVYQENRRVDFKIVGAEYVAPKLASAKKTNKKPVTKKPVPKKKKK